MLTVSVSTISNSKIFLRKNVSSFANISVYGIFNDQTFNHMLTNIVSFEQLGPEVLSVTDELTSWCFHSDFLCETVNNVIPTCRQCW